MLGIWARHIPGLSLLCSPGPAERRTEARHALRIGLEARVAGQSYPAQSINLSSGGVLIDRALPARRGSAVRLTAAGFGRTLGGRVDRTGAHSTAIVFDSRSAGRALVDWALGQPAAHRPANDRHVSAAALGRVSVQHRRVTR